MWGVESCHLTIQVLLPSLQTDKQSTTVFRDKFVKETEVEMWPLEWSLLDMTDALVGEE